MPTGAALSQISFNEGQNVPGIAMEWCLREKNRLVNNRYLQETLEREQKNGLYKAFDDRRTSLCRRADSDG